VAFQRSSLAASLRKKARRSFGFSSLLASPLKVSPEASKEPMHILALHDQLEGLKQQLEGLSDGLFPLGEPGSSSRASSPAQTRGRPSPHALSLSSDELRPVAEDAVVSARQPTPMRRAREAQAEAEAEAGVTPTRLFCDEAPAAAAAAAARETGLVAAAAVQQLRCVCMMQRLSDAAAACLQACSVEHTHPAKQGSPGGAHTPSQAGKPGWGTHTQPSREARVGHTHPAKQGSPGGLNREGGRLTFGSRAPCSGCVNWVEASKSSWGCSRLGSEPAGGCEVACGRLTV
jgi:hypothetical protein